MHALLSLLGVFFTTVLVYLAAGIAFVGIVFLIVYVGAVAVLFLFVIMLLNVKSLTSKETLLRHSTQWLAIFAAAALYYELYFHVFAAVSQASISGSSCAASTELTTGDAVLAYVRYGSADINRLIGLYGEHSPTLLVTTIFLLVSLLGAIILATVTTERATALTDIRRYDSPALASAILLLFVPPYSGALLNELQEFLAVNLGPSEIILMSFFTRFSHRNREVNGLDQAKEDTVRLPRIDPVQKVLPFLLPKGQLLRDDKVTLLYEREYKRAELEEKKKQPLF
jgi:NADH:ubiquinone oxidoreductase subunit 6 (subunit J)